RKTECPLRHGLERIEIRHFLQHAFGELLTRAMAENDDKGDAVGESIDDGRESVASPWPFGHHRHARLAAAAGVAVGHENGGLFVARENQWNIILLMKRVEQRKDVVTRQCRDEFNPLRLEDIKDGICNTHINSYLSTGICFDERVRADNRNGNYPVGVSFHPATLDDQADTYLQTFRQSSSFPD